MSYASSHQVYKGLRISSTSIKFLKIIKSYAFIIKLLGKATPTKFIDVMRGSRKLILSDSFNIKQNISAFSPKNNILSLTSLGIWITLFDSPS